MEPALTVAALCTLFSATHIGLAVRPVREPLVARLGERGFTLLFSSTAAVTFALLIHTYSRLRGLGAPGPALGSVPVLGAALGVLVGIGVVLMIATFATYSSSPMSASKRVREPRGLERVTRHSFFAGVALFGLAHALLSPTLAGSVFFTGLTLHAVLGALHQDRKLLRRRGAPYAEFLAATSAVPFAALLTGRQRIVWSELPWLVLAIAIGLAFALRAVHASIFDYGGAWIIGVVVGGAFFALAAQWRAIPGRETPGAVPTASPSSSMGGSPR